MSNTYNFIIGDDMKDGAIGIIKLVVSILIIFLINTFFFDALGLINIKPTGTGLSIAIFIKYLAISASIFGIYYRNILASKIKVSRSKFANMIYCLACFLFLILITIILHQTLNLIGKSKGISIGYYFKDYFNQKFSIELVLNIIIESVFMPFLLCVIFPLGFSTIFKRNVTSVTLSGISYGILYGLSLNTSLEIAIMRSITPACIVMLLTYLFKINNNIVSVIVTYAIYVLFGIFAINYIL